MSTPEPIVVSEVTIVLEPNEVAVTKLTTELELNAPGPQGPPGPAGADGAPGLPGAPGGAFFVHTQSTPVASWAVEHGLNRLAHITIIDDDGMEVEADVDQSDTATAVITFPSPHTGTVIVS